MEHRLPSSQQKQKDVLPEGFGELLGTDGFVAVLQFIENPLQRQGNALAGVIPLGGHHVDRLGKERERERDQHETLDPGCSVMASERWYSRHGLTRRSWLVKKSVCSRLFM